MNDQEIAQALAAPIEPIVDGWTKYNSPREMDEHTWRRWFRAGRPQLGKHQRWTDEQIDRYVMSKPRVSEMTFDTHVAVKIKGYVDRSFDHMYRATADFVRREIELAKAELRAEARGELRGEMRAQLREELKKELRAEQQQADLQAEHSAQVIEWSELRAQRAG